MVPKVRSEKLRFNALRIVAVEKNTFHAEELSPEQRLHSFSHDLVASTGIEQPTASSFGWSYCLLASPFPATRLPYVYDV